MEIKQLKPKDTSRACRVLKISRSSLKYIPKKDDSEVIELIKGCIIKQNQEGCWKYYNRIRNKGHLINYKRVYRVYKEMGLTIKKKPRKHLPDRVRESLEQPKNFNHTWSIDFMSDALKNTRKIRSFHVIDDYNREVLFIEQDYSLKSRRILWVLQHLTKRYGKPQKIRMDNGPEFIADLAKEWSLTQDIEFKYIEPGKPTQNAYIERFNKSFRKGVLDAHIFDSIEQLRDITAIWVNDYNHERPHESLGNISPVAFRLKNNKELKLPVLRSASATPSLHSAQEVLISI